MYGNIYLYIYHKEYKDLCHSCWYIFQSSPVGPGLKIWNLADDFSAKKWRQLCGLGRLTAGS